VVIDDRNVLNDITVFHHNAKMLKNAACAILVCGDEVKAMIRVTGRWIVAQLQRIFYWQLMPWVWALAGSVSIRVRSVLQP